MKVTLLAVTEFVGGVERPLCSALAFDEHQQLVADLVVLGHVQFTARPDQFVIPRIELCHPCFLRKEHCSPGARVNAPMIAETGRLV